MYRLGLLGVVSACGFGAPAGTDGVMDAGRDAPPMIDAQGPSDDVDNDGVANASDNCPEHGNAKQFDEDADGAGDECDPCPQIANEPVDDGDGDGIANICDPHPEILDVRVRFDGFHEGATLPTGWSHVLGDEPVTIQNGSLVVSSDNDPNIIGFDVGSAQHSIEVGFRVTDADTGSQRVSAVSALADMTPGGGAFFLCGVRIDSPTGRELWRFSPGNTTPLQSINAAVAVPDDYAVRLSTQTTGPQCEVFFDTSSSLLQNAAAPTASHFVGVRLRNADAEIRYIAIYRH